MRFAVLARVVAAAACVTLVAAATLEGRELEDLRSPDTPASGGSGIEGDVDTDVVTEPASDGMEIELSVGGEGGDVLENTLGEDLGDEKKV